MLIYFQLYGTIILEVLQLKFEKNKFRSFIEKRENLAVNNNIIRKRIIAHLKVIFLDARNKYGIKTQKEFGEKYLDADEKYTSEIMNGKKNLCEKKAKRLKEYFPEYRLDWILGKDEFKTESEKTMWEIYKKGGDINKRIYAFQELAALVGYDLDYFVENEPIDVMEEKSINGYTLQSKDKSLNLTGKEIELISLDILEFVELRINSLIRQKENRLKF